MWTPTRLPVLCIKHCREERQSCTSDCCTWPPGDSVDRGMCGQMVLIYVKIHRTQKPPQTLFTLHFVTWSVWIMYGGYTELSAEHIQSYIWCVYELGNISALSNRASASMEMFNLLSAPVQQEKLNCLGKVQPWKHFCLDTHQFRWLKIKLQATGSEDFFCYS